MLVIRRTELEEYMNCMFVDYNKITIDKGIAFGLGSVVVKDISTDSLSVRDTW
jgi:hypothetical protein